MVRKNEGPVNLSFDEEVRLEQTLLVKTRISSQANQKIHISVSVKTIDRILMDPSQNSCHGRDFFNFLGNTEHRSQFNLIVKYCREYHIWQAKNGFLRQLIENKIITRHYRVKNKGNDTQTEAATNTSLEWMSTDLEKNETREYELFEQLKNEYNALVVLIPPHLREYIKDNKTEF